MNRKWFLIALLALLLPAAGRVAASDRAGGAGTATAVFGVS